MCEQETLLCNATFWLTIFGISIIIALISVFINQTKRDLRLTQTSAPTMEEEFHQEEEDKTSLQNQAWMKANNLTDISNRSIIGYFGLLGEVNINLIGYNRPNQHFVVSYEAHGGEIISLYLPRSLVRFHKVDQDPKMVVTWDEDLLDEDFEYYQDYLEDALNELDPDSEYINETSIERIDIYLSVAEHSKLLKTKA